MDVFLGGVLEQGSVAECDILVATPDPRWFPSQLPELEKDLYKLF